MRDIKPATDQHYEDGFLTGWLDAGLGQNYPITVVNAYPEGWGKGYKEGQEAYKIGQIYKKPQKK